MSGVLSRAELNRATLARQGLLRRERLDTVEAVARVAGLQAQERNPPYVGLWTRLEGFRRDELTEAMRRREVVRGTLMRSTIHVMTAEDYGRFRATLEPALLRAFFGFNGARAKRLDLPAVVGFARELFEQRPRSFAELRAALAEHAPEEDPYAMAYAARALLPLVQVFPAGTWGTGGSVEYALADWPLAPADRLRELVHRYLAAFGPASVRDVQAWSGLVRLREPLAALRDELEVYRDERGTELLDLPGAPLPGADTAAPVRFLPEYDNLVLAHADRSRVIAAEHKRRVYLTAGRVRATFLVDGFVAGTWRVKDGALELEPFERLPAGARAALAEEGERLLAFLNDYSAL